METTTATGLTRENLKTLRNADDIVVRFHSEHFKYKADGEVLPRTFLDCIKQVDPGDGFGKREMRVEVDVEPAGFRVFDQKGQTDQRAADPISHALWSLHPKWAGNEQHTFIHHLLRVGDRLTPLWVCNNNSDNIRNAGLTVDEFKFEIVRGPVDEPSKCKRLVVLLDSAVYPPHNLARNVTWA